MLSWLACESTVRMRTGREIQRAKHRNGLSAAAVGLLANQVIAQLWHRPRPYQDHPLGALGASIAGLRPTSGPEIARSLARRRAYQPGHR
jgi:hypothetical protein